jgi:hypothetical protein
MDDGVAAPDRLADDSDVEEVPRDGFDVVRVVMSRADEIEDPRRVPARP